MKPNYTKLSIVLLGIFYIALTMFFLYGCKNPQVIYKTENKYITDTLIVNGDTIIRNIEVKQECPECKPKTRLETRLEYRLDKKALQVMKLMYEDSLKEARKINASNNDRIKYVTKWKTKEVVKLSKTQNKKPFNWFWVGLGIGIFIPIYLKFVIKKVYETNN